MKERTRLAFRFGLLARGDVDEESCFEKLANYMARAQRKSSICISHVKLQQSNRNNLPIYALDILSAYRVSWDRFGRSSIRMGKIYQCLRCV